MNKIKDGLGDLIAQCYVLLRSSDPQMSSLSFYVGFVNVEGMLLVSDVGLLFALRPKNSFPLWF